VLLSGAAKTKRRLMAGLALLIAAGLFVEKLVLVLPAAPVSVFALALEAALLIGLIAAHIKGSYSVLPQGITPQAESESQT